MFRRIEVATSLSWDHKEVPQRKIDRQALLLTNQISLVHDNALFGYNGPQDGWRGRISAAYTTDLLYSNVNYITLEGRHSALFEDSTERYLCIPRFGPHEPWA